jgi:hypothetical protein
MLRTGRPSSKLALLKIPSFEGLFLLAARMPISKYDMKGNEMPHYQFYYRDGAAAQGDCSAVADTEKEAKEIIIGKIAKLSRTITV